MWIPTFRLEADGVEPLLLNEPTNNLGVYDVDLGFPEVRAVVRSAPDADGTLDSTAHFGARVITLRLWLDAVPWATRQRLFRFLNPALRPTMYFQLEADQPEQLVRLRGDQLTAGLPAVMHIANQRDVLLQWVAPLGVVESASLNTADLAGAEAAPEVGRSYDLAFDRTYPASPVVGSVVATNAGNTDAYPVLRIYGPCTDPVLYNDTQGKALAFAGLSVSAADYLEIDTRAKTIRTNSLAASSQYSKLDFPSSEWWTLSPGDNQLRFVPDTFTAPSYTRVEWRDAWI